MKSLVIKKAIKVVSILLMLTLLIVAPLNTTAAIGSEAGLEKRLELSDFNIRSSADFMYASNWVRAMNPTIVYTTSNGISSYAIPSARLTINARDEYNRPYVANKIYPANQMEFRSGFNGSFVGTVYDTDENTEFVGYVRDAAFTLNAQGRSVKYSTLTSELHPKKLDSMIY